MAEFTLTLGGQTYRCKPLSIRQSKEWRSQFATPFNQLTQALAGVERIELTSGKDLAALLGTLSGVLIGSTDTLLDMLFAYAPELAADRERIEAEATDAEGLAAFVEVLKAAYPFGSLLGLVRSGPARAPTSKS